MKRFLLASLLFAAYIIGYAQPYGNEWIDASRTHYKIRITANGIYRIPYSTLAANIPNISSLNTKNLILYHNGEAVPMYISSNGTFGSTDYIEFYGKRN